ncbi:hypothetical protein BJY00DRAFT_289220, partial [Aspergillus carlsbadensis]
MAERLRRAVQVINPNLVTQQSFRISKGAWVRIPLLSFCFAVLLCQPFLLSVPALFL